MSDSIYLLKHISILMNVGIFCVRDVLNSNTEKSKDEEIESLQENPKNNPIYRCKTLRERLKTGADNQKEPYICKDAYMVYFACVKKADHYYMIGPMSLKLLERIELHQYYKIYGIGENQEKRLMHFNFSQVMDIVETVANILCQEEYEDNELIYANKLVTDTKEQEEREQVLFDMKEGEEELYHHTYQEERKLLDSIKEGRVEDALRLNRNMDADLGKLSKKELNHWKNVAIVAITLCTRAAIDGGISPSIAYRISDFYIQKSDGSTDIAQIIKYRDHAAEELTEQVRKKKARKVSGYVERCEEYVFRIIYRECA